MPATLGVHDLRRRGRNTTVGNGCGKIERYTSLRVCFFASIVAIHLYLLRVESIIYRELTSSDEVAEGDSILAKALRDGTAASASASASRKAYDDSRLDELSTPVSRNGFLSRGSLRSPFIFSSQHKSDGDLTFDHLELEIELAKHNDIQQHSHETETNKMLAEKSKPRILPRTVTLSENVGMASQSKSERNSQSKTQRTMELEDVLENKRESEIDETTLILEFEKPFFNDCERIISPMPTIHPTCNNLHELPFSTSEIDSNLLSMKGSWRSVWKISLDDPSRYVKDLKNNAATLSIHSNNTAETNQKKEASSSMSVVLKMLHLHRRFDRHSYEAHSTDIIVMDRLTASPYVVNAYGFCGQSVVTEYASSTGRDYVKRYDIGSRERMRIARDLARGLSDVQALQPMPHDEIVANRTNDGTYDNTPSIPVVFAHNDINIANTVMVNGRIKWNDFNIGVFMRNRKHQPEMRFGSSKERHHRPPIGKNMINTVQNTISSSSSFTAFTDENSDESSLLCPAPVKYRSDMWRSPEEIKNASYVQMTQTDMYGIANILYQTMTRHQPWTYKEPGGALTTSDIASRKAKGGMPTIPEQYLNTTKRELQTLFAATNMCFFPTPEKRPTARRLAFGLGSLYEKLKRKERVTKTLILDYLLPPAQ